MADQFVESGCVTECVNGGRLEIVTKARNVTIEGRALKERELQSLVSGGGLGARLCIDSECEGQRIVSCAGGPPVDEIFLRGWFGS
jgi:hypothetical protein